jgi:hypothetical protein
MLANQTQSLEELRWGLSRSENSRDDVAYEDLPPTNPSRLEKELKNAIYCYEVLKSPDQACNIAKEAFDGAICELDSLSEDSYSGCACIMQQLRECLTLWSCDDAVGRKAPAPAPLRTALPTEPPQVVRTGDGRTVVLDFAGFCRTHRAPSDEVCAWVAEALALTPGLSVKRAGSNLDVTSAVAVLPAMVVEALLAFLRLRRRGPAGSSDGCNGPDEIPNVCDGPDKCGDAAPTAAMRSAALTSLAVGDARASATTDGDCRSLEASDALLFWELDEALAHACGVRLTTVRCSKAAV